MGRMADIRGSRGPGGEPADGHDPASEGQFLEEGTRGVDFDAYRAPVRGRRPGMRRDDVPAERLELQFREDALDDRRGRFGRAAAGELPLGGERDARDACASVTGRLAHEQQQRGPPDLEVLTEPGAAKIRTRSVPVEVERRPDSSRSEPPDEPFRLHAVTMLMRVRGRIAAVPA